MRLIDADALNEKLNEQIDSTGLSDAEKAEIEAQEAKEAEEVE